MARNGVRDVAASVTGKPHPEREVRVFVVTEERLVEAADVDERRAAVEGRRGTRREGLACGALDARRLALVAPPREAAHVVRVTGSIKRPVVCIEHEPAAEEAALGMLVRSREERLEPVRLGERVGVEKRDELTVCAEPDCEVVGGGKADVVVELNELDCGKAVGKPVERAVDARVVDDDDPMRRESLPFQALECELQVPARVRVDDDDADCGVHVVLPTSSRRSSSRTARRAKAAPT